MGDTREELKRLEQELLAEETVDDALLDELIQEVKAETAAEEDIFLDDALLRELLPEDAMPAFEDPEKIHEPEELIYSNYANDYGKDLEDAAEEKQEQAHEDKLQIILMIAASVLALGIIGILIYWLVAFF